MNQSITVRCITTEFYGHDYITTVDPGTGIFFADTEKTLTDRLDDNDCWLAAASNIMMWSGWVSAGTSIVANEDRFFDYGVSKWGNVGGFESNAFTWWVNGTASLVRAPSGGNQLPSIDPEDHLLVYSGMDKEMLPSLKASLEAGFGVTLGVFGDGLQHAITCWGYEEVDGVTYLYYSDSDDDKYVRLNDRRGAPNFLGKMSVVYDAKTGKYMIPDYYATGYIRDFTAIAQYDSIFLGRQEEFLSSRAFTVDSVRRGRFDATNDDDLYTFTASGSSSAIGVMMYEGATSLIKFELYDSGRNLVYSTLDYTVFENLETQKGAKYFLKITGSVAVEIGFMVDVYVLSGSSENYAVKWNNSFGSFAKKLTVNGRIFAAGESRDFFVDGAYQVAIIGSSSGCKTVYGGSTISDIEGDCRVFVQDADMSSIIGGGGNYEINGNIYVRIAGKSSVKSIISGGGSSLVSGGISMQISLKNCSGNIFGGTTNNDVLKDTSITILSGSYTGMIYGGSRSSVAEKLCTLSDISITLSGIIAHQDNIKLLASGNSAWLIGGGQAVGGGSVESGNVTIRVANGAQIYRIVGGGQAENAGSVAQVGNVNITISCGEVNGNIYGGGYAREEATSIVKGSTSIFINAIENISIIGDIFGGGVNPRASITGGSSLVLGDSKVSFSGSGDMLNFAGSVSGDGAIFGTVAGKKELEFNGFTGEFNATAKNFDKFTFSNGSNVFFSTVQRVSSMLFSLTGKMPAVDKAMVKADSFDWEFEGDNAGEVYIDPKQFTRNQSVVLLEGGNSEELAGLWMDFYSSSGAILGMCQIDYGSRFSIGNGYISLSLKSNSLMLNFAMR